MNPVRGKRARRFYGRARTHVTVSLERHADRRDGTKTGLSAKGIAKARKGRRVPASFRIKGYHGLTPRTVSTIELGQKAAKRRGIKIYPTPKLKLGMQRGKRHELSGDYYILNETAVDRLIEKRGEAVFLRDWLDGKISKKIMMSPQTVADAIIRKRFALGARASRRGIRKVVMRNITRGWNPEAVFERLTGRRYEFTTPRNTMVRPSESLTVSFLANGKAILSFRRKKYDVTANLNRIRS